MPASAKPRYGNRKQRYGYGPSALSFLLLSDDMRPRDVVYVLRSLEGTAQFRSGRIHALELEHDDAQCRSDASMTMARPITNRPRQLLPDHIAPPGSASAGAGARRK